MQIFVAIGAGLVLTGSLLAAYGIARHRRQDALYTRARSSWVKTKATIVEAGIAEHESTDSDGDSITSYEPHLRYQYVAGGSAREGRRTALLGPLQFNQLGPAEEWLLAHRPGAEIDIWYDPERTDDSAAVLNKPATLSTAAMLIVGMGFVGSGGALLLGLI